MILTAAEIADLVNGELQGNPAAVVTDVSSVSHARPERLVFLADPREKKMLANCTASVVLIPAGCDCSGLDSENAAWISVADPFGAFMSLVPRFRRVRDAAPTGIAPTAVVSATAILGADVRLGDHVRIGAESRLGKNCVIHANVCIGDDVILGDDVTLFPGVVLYSGCRLGNRVTVHANTVLGADGFGYRFQGGEFHKLPHYGRVIVEDDVEIGACTTIDRGMIEDTVIGRGTKIDNQVMIAHNCRIGQHNVIVSQVGMAGSVTTGDYCRFGGQVGIADHVEIGAQSSLVAQAGVFRDIPAGETMGGSPAVPMNDQKKIALATLKLPEMRQTVRQLQKQVESLEARLSAKTSADHENTEKSTEASQETLPLKPRHAA